MNRRSQPLSPGWRCTQTPGGSSQLSWLLSWPQRWAEIWAKPVKDTLGILLDLLGERYSIFYGIISCGETKSCWWPALLPNETNLPEVPDNRKSTEKKGKQTQGEMKLDDIMWAPGSNSTWSQTHSPLVTEVSKSSTLFCPLNYSSFSYEGLTSW